MDARETRQGEPARWHAPLLATCTGCPVRGDGCGDCLITVMYASAPPADAPTPRVGETATPLPLDARERRAIASLLGAGLIDEAEASAAYAVREELPLRHFA